MWVCDSTFALWSGGRHFNGPRCMGMWRWSNSCWKDVPMSGLRIRCLDSYVWSRWWGFRWGTMSGWCEEQNGWAWWYAEVCELLLSAKADKDVKKKLRYLKPRTEKGTWVICVQSPVKDVTAWLWCKRSDGWSNMRVKPGQGCHGMRTHYVSNVQILR